VGWFTWLGGALPSLAWAETVYLKNGNVLEGEIIAENEQQVVIEIPDVGQLAFSRTEIEGIAAHKEQRPYQYLVVLKNGNTFFGAVTEEAGQVHVDIPGTGVVSFNQADVERVDTLDAEKAKALEDKFRREARLALEEAQLQAQTMVGYGASEGDLALMDEERMLQEFNQQRQQVQAAVQQAQALAQQGRIGTLLRMQADRVGGPALTDQQARVVDLVFRFFQVLGGWFYLIMLLIGMYFACCIQTLATKTEADSEWMAWVPVLHLYLASQIGGKPWWWVFLFAIPVLNLIADVGMWMGIARSQNRSVAWGFLALFPVLNLIMAGVLAFGHASTKAQAA
jgi:hypothetical protein